jgi:hypothetical protein
MSNPNKHFMFYVLVILDQSLVFRVTNTRRCIDKIASPGDEHGVARNM